VSLNPTPPQSLPIHGITGDLLAAARAKHRRLVLQAPTGSGKSTQVPQMLVDGEAVPAREQVVVLQPRRLAARMLARRVAAERRCPLGGEVGYHIRFDRQFGPQTRIKYVTEGLLVRQMLSEPELPGVGAVVLDEFHERHLDTDLALALARRLQETKRPDLLLVVMSATLQAQALAGWLRPCAVLEAAGRTYPVDVEYSAAAAAVAERPVWEQAAHHVGRLARVEPEGDFLVFMPGAYEINKTIEALCEASGARELDAYPLYGDLPPERQDAAVTPGPRRRAVVATNVAETSLTIEGVRTVVDSGLARVARYDPHRGINTLLIEKISQASAEQRAGRAGRTGPGRCLRLWGEREHALRPPHETPEIQRVDLAETLLFLKAAGIRDVDTFPWFEPPNPEALERARLLLEDLGALDRSGTLTAEGRQMADFPLHPRYARMLIEADKRGCVFAVAHVVALAQERDIMLPLRERRAQNERDELLGDTSSDFFHRLRLFGMARKKNHAMGFCRQWGIHAAGARQVERLAAQLLGIARTQQLDTHEHPMDEDAVRHCILLGFADHLARRLDRGTLRCALVHGRRGELRRQSAVREAPLLVAGEIDEVQQRGEVNVLLSLATAVEENWLHEYFPSDFAAEETALYDRQQKRVVARKRTVFRGLVLRDEESPDVSTEAAARILSDAVEAGVAELKGWNGEVERFIARINFAAKHCPEFEVNFVDALGRRLLLEQACHGARSQRELREADVWPVVRDWLTQEQALALEEAAPDALSLPRRKKPVRIGYAPDGGTASIAARIQDFYDVSAASLRIAGGRYPLTVELLAPNHRPIQVTRDLDAFWKNSYEDVKKQLKGRYPKHEWR